MARVRIIYRGYSIEVWQVRSTYTVAIEPVGPELSIFGRRITDGFASNEEAVEFAKGRIDALLKG